MPLRFITAKFVWQTQTVKPLNRARVSSQRPKIPAESATAGSSHRFECCSSPCDPVKSWAASDTEWQVEVDIDIGLEPKTPNGRRLAIMLMFPTPPLPPEVLTVTMHKLST